MPEPSRSARAFEHSKLADHVWNSKPPLLTRSCSGVQRLEDAADEALRVRREERACRPRGLAERLDEFHRRRRVGVREVVDLPVRVVEAAQVRDGVDDVVAGHDVELRVAGAVGRRDDGVVALVEQRLDEDVRPVVLPSLARVAVADGGARPVDRRRDLVHPLLDEHLGGVLRGLVVVAEQLALQQHVLGEQALVEPGDDDGADVMEAVDVGALGEL